MNAQQSDVHGLPAKWRAAAKVSGGALYLCANELEAALRQSGEAVAWGFPNSRPTAGESPLMMVRLEVPSDDQYNGALWVPLYTAPPATSGLVEAAKSALGLLAMYRETLEAGMGANERAALRHIGNNLSATLAAHDARGGA